MAKKYSGFKASQKSGSEASSYGASRKAANPKRKKAK